jgi:nucleotide-binding universal stress UspA family protein
MKKILLAFDGSHYSEGALEFAKRLNQKNPIFLAGIFLPQIDYSALWSYSGGSKLGSLFIPLVEDEDSIAVQANITRFESFCHENNIECQTHTDFFDFALPELKKESRFADLLILSSEKFFEQASAGVPNEYLKETLFGVECPVIVVPEKFDFPTNNILAYDGKESSVYAIKQFTYLFPELSSNETILIYANEKDGGDLPHHENIKELISHHFQKFSLYYLEANPGKHFPTWLKDQHASILVTGAFGGSGLSRLFHKSFTADVIRDHRLPVFIAHK